MHFLRLYIVAKEQGYRSRAAFKLTQIHRQYPILDQAKTILDLCAAPGGWTQVVARTCPSATQIVAVDILPIRSFSGASSSSSSRNITTIVGDITTEKCKADIHRALAHQECDVVLHDGAPNIGASYEKDAYEQTELAVHALRCATQHLKHRGVFVTKLYRSRDYASYLWVVQQLFKEVTAFKPKASRSQSAEIFLICQGYLKPDKIDPRMLDPKHIFEFVEGDTTGGANLTNSSSASWNVFHKQWDKPKRQRDGYNSELLDATMRHIQPVKNFIHATGLKEAIQLLSDCTGFSFVCPTCSPNKEEKDKSSTNDADDSLSCSCQFYLHHPLTTPEIKECVTDLKLLNKSDFKGLLTWRDKMIKAMESMKDDDGAKGSDGKEQNGDDDDDHDRNDDSVHNQDSSSLDEEEMIQGEITQMRARKLREKKKQKKKERAKLAKKRRQAALGMDLNAIDVPDHDQVFSLATVTSKGALEAVSEVNLDRMTDEQVFGADSDDDDDEDDDPNNDQDPDDEDRGNFYKRERELDAAYERYLTTTKNGAASSRSLL